MREHDADAPISTIALAGVDDFVGVVIFKRIKAAHRRGSASSVLCRAARIDSLVVAIIVASAMPPKSGNAACCNSVARGGGADNG